MEFNRKKLIENINNLIQQRKLKVGEVEQAIGISTGYLSRLSKTGNESIPATDVVWKLARHLGVSTDALISGDFSEITDNISVLRKFVSKLKLQTGEELLKWSPVTTEYVNKVLKGDEPLFFLVQETDMDRGIPKTANDTDEKKITYPWYHNRMIAPAAANGDPAWMLGDGYKTTLPNGKRVYLFYMGTEMDDGDEIPTIYQEFYEMYLEEWIPGKKDDTQTTEAENGYWKATEIFSTLGPGYDVWDELWDLHTVVSMAAYDVMLETGVKDTILNFLKDDDAEVENLTDKGHTEA